MIIFRNMAKVKNKNSKTSNELDCLANFLFELAFICQVEQLISQASKGSWFLDAYEIMLEIGKQLSSRTQTFGQNSPDRYINIKIDFNSGAYSLHSQKELDHRLTKLDKKNAFNAIDRSFIGVLCTTSPYEILDKYDEIEFCVDEKRFYFAKKRFDSYYANYYQGVLKQISENEPDSIQVIDSIKRKELITELERFLKKTGGLNQGEKFYDSKIEENLIDYIKEITRDEKHVRTLKYLAMRLLGQIQNDGIKASLKELKNPLDAVRKQIPTLAKLIVNKAYPIVNS